MGDIIQSASDALLHASYLLITDLLFPAFFKCDLFLLFEVMKPLIHILSVWNIGHGMTAFCLPSYLFELIDDLLHQLKRINIDIIRRLIKKKYCGTFHKQTHHLSLDTLASGKCTHLLVTIEEVPFNSEIPCHLCKVSGIKIIEKLTLREKIIHRLFLVLF